MENRNDEEMEEQKCDARAQPGRPGGRIIASFSAAAVTPTSTLHGRSVFFERQGESGKQLIF
jgi:hypothetical protein